MKEKMSRGGRIVCAATYVWAGVSAVLYVAMRLSTPFAEFFNNTVSAVSRRAFAFVTDFVPFSVAEAAVLLSPLIVILAAVWTVMRIKKFGAAGAKKVVAVCLAVISFAGSAFVFNGAAGYFGLRMAERLDLDTSDPTAEELYSACLFLADRINGAVDEGPIFSDVTGATVMSSSVAGTALQIESLYDSFSDRYGFPQSFTSIPKVLVTSPLVTYTHISGLFSDTTCEVNINTNYPDYVVVSTIAHELAHQRGVAPEDEANFTAFAVLEEAHDPYLRYAGCLDAYSTVSYSLYKTDKKLWQAAGGRLCKTARDDLAAFSRFYEKYADNKAAQISEKVNDAYLKSQGTSGTVSYDEALILIVRYIAKLGKP